MNELKKYIIAQISNMVPEFEKLEFRSSITDTSRSSEFFVTIAGERFQCYEMVDGGLITDEALDNAFSAITKYWRTSPDYESGKINKLSFVFDKK